MTTNKPDVKRYDCTSGGSGHCYGCYTMTETELGDYVSSEDYEALQAECERLRNLLVEIERGCSRRDMPSEQTISSWADAIDAAIHAVPQEVSP